MQSGGWVVQGVCSVVRRDSVGICKLGRIRFVLYGGGQGAVTEFGIGGDTYEDTVRNLGLHLRHRLGRVIVILREEACWEGT